MCRDDEPCECEDDGFFCDHMDADFDIMTGKIRCNCGYSHYMTTEEYRRRMDFEANSDAHFQSFIAKYERERVVAEICLPPVDPALIDESIPF